MSKRKLDTNRLYKFIKRGVIVLTLLLILKFVLFDLNSFRGIENAFYYASDQCRSNYTLYSPKYEDCTKDASKELDTGLHKASQIQIHDILLIILLPGLFFGCGWAYKYLFPLKETYK